jgi:hypothetical protein
MAKYFAKALLDYDFVHSYDFLLTSSMEVAKPELAARADRFSSFK